MIAGCEFGREGTDDLDAGLELGVGRIDDAECGFAARHQRQRGAHAFGHREFRLGGLPGAKFFQRRPGVFADRHGPDVAGCDLAVTGEFGEVEAGADIHVVDPGILRRDQHDAVAEQVDPGRLVDVLPGRGVVHPVGVGGDEHVGRRALFDLFCQCRAGSVAHGDLDAGLCGIGCVDVVERVLHRGGGEHGEGLVLRRGRRMGRSEHDDEGCEKSGEAVHGSAPCIFAGRVIRAQIMRWLVLGMRPTEALFR